MMDFVEKFDPGARERALSLLPAESREVYESSPRSSWLSIEHDHWVVDGICETFGVERAVACWRASVPDLVDKPLLKSFVSGMMRVFGSSRTRVVSLLPRAWGAVYRDFCTPRVSQHASGATVTFYNIAHPVWQYPNYFNSWRGVCEGMLDLAELEGTVEFQLERDRRRAVAEFSWSI